VIPFLVNRAAHAVLVLVAVSLLAFVLGDVVGDPVASILGMDATDADRAALRARLHLDEPFVVRYGHFVVRLLSGDLGTSYGAQRPVIDLLAERIPATVELAFVALALSLGVGIPLGVYAAARRGDRIVGALMTLSVLGVSLPTFLTGIVLILVFSIGLGWLPSFGRGEVVRIGGWTTGFLTESGLRSLVMPAVSLAIGQIALVARLSRAEMLGVLRTDYIRFARARGLPSRLVHFRHALRNTLVPVLTVAGLQLGSLIAFAIITETVFQWPGLGLLFIEAVTFADVPVMAAYLCVVALVFVTINLGVDLLYAVVDPRLHPARRQGG
jgi:peptide/nickel transport system permease protein